MEMVALEVALVVLVEALAQGHLRSQSHLRMM